MITHKDHVFDRFIEWKNMAENHAEKKTTCLDHIMMVNVQGLFQNFSKNHGIIHHYSVFLELLSKMVLQRELTGLWLMK